jgi:hypothetical protein
MAKAGKPFRVVRRERKWWITNVPPYDVDGKMYTEYGPYDDRDEAESDAVGVARTFEKIAEEEKARAARRS